MLTSAVSLILNAAVKDADGVVILTLGLNRVEVRLLHPDKERRDRFARVQVARAEDDVLTAVAAHRSTAFMSPRPFFPCCRGNLRSSSAREDVVAVYGRGGIPQETRGAWQWDLVDRIRVGAGKRREAEHARPHAPGTGDRTSVSARAQIVVLGRSEHSD